MSDNPLSVRTRKKIRAQLEKAERERYINAFNHRMDLVRFGCEALKKKDLQSAAQYFLNYLAAIERKKGTDIVPSLFDPNKDAAEILMLTGVYWDLAKIYDRMPKKENPKLKRFLDKFILFSKGTKYEKLSAEMLRKFLIHSSPNYRSLFKEAHLKLGGGRCFIATAVEEHCEPNAVFTLKRYRDEVLSKNIFGRTFIKIYYQVSPWIALRLIRSPERWQKKVAKILSDFASAISFRFFQDEK